MIVLRFAEFDLYYHTTDVRSNNTNTVARERSQRSTTNKVTELSLLKTQGSEIEVLRTFVELWILGELDGSMLSTNSIGFCFTSVTSANNVISHIMSLAASLAATYSASVVDNATLLCFCLCHNTVPPAHMQTAPVR
ncbi:hypothetical protein T12_216 [Trichinella patagoniensis]|uniref:Uncharacterized protein n=1 Tax=Trichinella patagoniensis TaxID=990121 RepID=A0A0V0Z4U1_9BILA|nr:hypothetical protein T12_6457 [Trichinella patagoniensis]KRY07561.1 hypothetical protein T12_2284 [Trichinella patagoniensis]KRY11496.1 hypothetical protein T12_2169 [Trichinella patagoniensis]KRY13783.1 hypothetical protein T12_216 [Trichinella patagoniensis]